MVEQGEEKVENEWFYNEENPSSTSLCLLLLTTGKKEKILCICCCSLFLLFYLLPLVPSTFSCLLRGVDHEAEFLEVQPGRISTVCLTISTRLDLLIVPAGVILVKGFSNLFFRQVFANANELLRIILKRRKVTQTQPYSKSHKYLTPRKFVFV